MAAAASSFQRTPTLHLSLTPNRLTSFSKFSSVSLQRTRQFPLLSSSSAINFSHKLLSSLSIGCFASSHDETIVAEDEKDVVVDESEQQVEDSESATSDDESSQSEVEESSATILVSLESYKQALADNNEPKIAEIEAQFKSFEDEKLFLETKVSTMSEELSNAKDRVLRISADFDNFRKRTDRERLNLVANAQGEVVENLLGVLDNFERARSQIKVETEKEEKINNSYQSIYKQFVEVLRGLGVVPVVTVGQQFDPLLHEAIMREDSSEFDEGVVIQEFRKGFRIGERLLRPSMVKVSAGPGPGTAVPVTESESEPQAIATEATKEVEDDDDNEADADDE